MNTTTSQPTPETLRTRMVNQIVQRRSISLHVERAMRALPRHAFVPEASLTDAYDVELAVITKRASDGTALSCASVPSLVATMLEQLNVNPGNRILEIGAGTGYNAALLAYLTGDPANVTTVDIDAEVTAGARRALDATGYQGVRVITRDGALGAREHAPYDRLTVTVGAWDIPETWWQQLTDDARLVVPLRWRGQTRSVGFIRHGDRMVSDSIELCGFVPMIGQDGEHSTALTADGTVTLYYDDDQDIDPTALRGVLDQPKHTAWSGEFITAGESFDGVWLRLTAAEPGTCRIAADQQAVTAGLCIPAIPARSPAIAEAASVAYFTLRRVDDADEPRWELGAISHGPASEQLADRMCEQIRAWSPDREAVPTITAYRVSTHDQKLPNGPMIDKPGTRLAITY